MLVGLRIHFPSPGLVAASTIALAQTLIAVKKVEVSLLGEFRVTTHARNPDEDPRGRHVEPKLCEGIRLSFSVHKTLSG
jgi:hypothetical protein